MATSTLQVVSADGVSRTAHFDDRSIGNGAFVYVQGHRVYGTVGSIALIGGSWERPFTAKGKWAYLVAARTAAVQPEATDETAISNTAHDGHTVSV